MVTFDEHQRWLQEHEARFGQMATATETAADKFERLHLAVSDMQSEIGKAFMPVVEKVLKPFVAVTPSDYFIDDDANMNIGDMIDGIEMHAGTLLADGEELRLIRTGAVSPQNEALLNELYWPSPSTWLCPYCGKRNREEQRAGGAGEWDGCGGAKS